MLFHCSPVINIRGGFTAFAVLAKPVSVSLMILRRGLMVTWKFLRMFLVKWHEKRITLLYSIILKTAMHRDFEVIRDCRDVFPIGLSIGY